jgi:hypothetical protein
MSIYLDGTKITVKSGTDPLQLLAVINEKLNLQGRVLYQVLVDGQTVEGDWLQALVKLSAEQSISFVSASPGQLLKESVINTIEVLPQLAVDLGQAANWLRIGIDQKAFPLISGAVGGLESYLQLLNVIAQYLPEQAVNSHQLVDPLTERLQKLMKAWHQEDFVLMADCLLYEVEPQIRRGHQWLQTLVA